MYFRVQVLESRGSLAGFGSGPRDQIVMRAGPPPSPRSSKQAPEQILSMSEPVGLTLSPEFSNDLKREITKPVKKQALDNFVVRFQVTKDGKWIGALYVRLVCLANGYVVERWINMKPAKDVDAGALRLRLVLRENEAAALAVWMPEGGNNVEPNELSRTKDCECDVCDPYGELYDPEAKRAQLEKDSHAIIVLGCVIS